MRSAAISGTPFVAVIVDAALSGIDAKLFYELVREDALLTSVPLLLLRKEDIGGAPLTDYSAVLDRSSDAPSVAYYVRTAAANVACTQDHGKPGAGKNILLVEDNPINMEVAKEMLEHLGYTCETASDGQESVDMVRKRRYDLVLMDCQMPGVDGYEATRQIRAWEESSCILNKTPIIAVTAHAMKGDRELCLKCGMNDYMTKPVEVTRLAAMIAKWLPVAREEGTGIAARSN
jgi:CheY-like chemotaxis protein